MKRIHGLHEYLCLRSPDEKGGGGGATTDEPPAGPETAPEGKPGTGEETVPKSAHEAELKRLHSEVDRYRNEAGQTKKRLKELEDAQKSEAERLQERAQRADSLEPELETTKQERDALRDALLAEVEAQKKALPKELLTLLPEKLSPVEQLQWIREARTAAEKLRPSKGELPPSGGRNPGPQEPGVTEQDRKAATQHYAGRF